MSKTTEEKNDWSSLQVISLVEVLELWFWILVMFSETFRQVYSQ